MAYIVDLSKALLKTPKLNREDIAKITKKHNINIKDKFEHLKVFKDHADSFEKEGLSFEQPIE